MRVLAVLFLSLLTPAQAQSIAGQVVDDQGEALVGVAVQVQGTLLGDASDADGRFEIVGVRGESVRLMATLLGYQTARVRATPGDADVRIVLREATLDAGEVVVTARETLTGRGTLDLPGSGHFVGRAALDRMQTTDVHRALAEVPGVTVQEEDGYGLRPNVGLRGSGSERSSTITLMEDGVPIAPAPYAAPSAYYFPSLGRMDGLEVRTGAGQIRYGPATTGGALNLIAAGIPERAGARGLLRLGANDQRTLHLRAGDTRRVGAFMLGAVGEVLSDNVDGFKTIQGAGGQMLTGPGGEPLDTGFDKLDLFGRVRLATAPGARRYQSLTLTASRTDEVSNETYLGLTDADFAATPFARYAGSRNDRMDADHAGLRLQHVAVLGRVDLTTTAYRNAFSRNWYKLDKASAGGDIVGIASILDAPAANADVFDVVRAAPGAAGNLYVKANNRDYLSRGVQSVAGLAMSDAVLVEAGLRLHADEMDRFQWVDRWAVADGDIALADAGTPGTDSNRIESARAVAGFVQGELAVGAVTLTPGVRVEHVRLRREDYGKTDPGRTGADLTTRENTTTALIPGLGAVTRLGGGWSAFGGLHRGFAPPDSRPETRPESSTNAELGLRFGGSAVQVQAAAYWTAYSNLLGSDLAAAGGGGTSDQFNGGRVDVRGAELGVSADALALAAPASRWAVPVRLAYTLSDGRFRNAFESDFDAWGDVAEGDALPYLPTHRLGARVGVERAGWSAGIAASAVSAMRAMAGQGAIPSAERIGAHVVLDATAEAPLPGGLALTARVANVTDAVYEVARRPAGLRPGLPRTLTVGLRARLGR